MKTMSLAKRSARKRKDRNIKRKTRVAEHQEQQTLERPSSKLQDPHTSARQPLQESKQRKRKRANATDVTSAIATIAGGAIIIAAAVYFGQLDTSWMPN